MSASRRLPDRPFGVTLIAFVTAAAVLWQLVGLVRLRSPAGIAPPGTAPAATLPVGTRPTDQTLALRRHVQLTTAWSLVGLLTAAGLYAMRRWGWYLALGYFGGNAVYAVVRTVEGPGQWAVPGVFVAGLGALVIWYLVSPDIRGQFRRQPLKG